ncbi:class 3 adenylate cyclase [Chelatococcus caeni]|uniref:Class 3 adenylate cyclase n=1 Tax=Chelatococcus caeni TaxID=1348468 RepID=A0A840C0F2_9HYPH|nr:adenylate/guanylate cyclase domain-containing protein [Chelatococcus caeni]MBB4018954.1 class 3 adenylate cyclase [Chelatococcus caeni]
MLAPRSHTQHQHRTATTSLAFLILPLVIGLPLAVWLDLRGLSTRMMQGEATEIGVLIDEMRTYYANDVLGRLDSESHGEEAPMPTAMSIELGKRISARDGAVKVRIFSDFPFRKRAGHPIDAFEQTALEQLRQDATRPVVDVSGTLVDRTVRIATPIVMGPACVACHNSHPDSPKQNWRVGDVRGVQEVTVRRPIEASIFSFQSLLVYFAVVAACGLAFIRMQSRQTALIRHMNGELAQANAFLGTVSAKIARYLSPQVYRSIFSGAKDVAITAERKKLTIFFSDIKDFTALTERLQPEDLTALLNEYFTEMSVIALRHGATIDKFVGDAILLFFGDPDTRGVREDAAAAVRMALDMQAALGRLNAEWRKRGLAEPLEVRMGINTGFCHVGNFGSDNRMDYTIIGAEANLAARLQAVAQPGSIVISYETYALVRDIVEAEALAPIAVKGVSRAVVPYVVRGLAGAAEAEVIHGQAQGLDLFLDIKALDACSAGETRRLLEKALTALETRAGRERPRAM